jgi:signal transduction histidine kinase
MRVREPMSRMTERGADYYRRVGIGALVFLLTTLAVLVLVPILVQRRVTALRDQIQASEPARTLTVQLQFHLVRQMLSVREVTGASNAVPVRTDSMIHADEEYIRQQLAPHIARLGSEAQLHYRDALARAHAWHLRMFADSSAPGSAGAPLQPHEEIDAFRDVLASVQALDEAILAHTARVRDRIESAESTGLTITYVLGLLALLSGVVAVWLEVLLRRLARNADRRRAEAEAALAEAARADEARARLMRGVTHDVKNPLGAARGYAELLEMGVKAPLHPEQAPLVEGIVRSVDGALAILADLLDLSRAEAGGLTIERVRVDLTDLVASAVDDHRASAEAAQHDLRYDRSKQALTVYTDPARVQQILGNLLSNAIKYTPSPGRIELRVAEVDGDTVNRAGLWATIRVADDGPGIPATLREAVFDEFTRVSDRSAIKGHGLGLAISRRIANLLGGDITLEEPTAKGAVFVLWLPCRDEEPAPAFRDVSVVGGSARTA